MLGKTTKLQAHTPHVMVRTLKPLPSCAVAHTGLLLAYRRFGTCRETSAETINLRRVNIAESDGLNYTVGET